MDVRFRGHKTVKIGPLRLNFTQAGFSSWGIHLWRYSWNARTRQHRVDTPGWGGLVFGGRRKKEN